MMMENEDNDGGGANDDYGDCDYDGGHDDGEWLEMTMMIVMMIMIVTYGQKREL